MSLPTVTKFVINTTQVNCFKETCLRVLSLCNSRALKEGVCVHSPITKLGLQEDLYLSNNLLSLYAKCFGVEPARHFFDEMPDRDVVSWTGMLSAYVRNGRYDEALEFFDSMSISGQCPNEFTLSTVLRSCSLLGDFDYGTRIHAYVIKLGFESNQYLGSTMIDLYAKCGFTDEACKIFRNMDNRDTISWTTIISSLVQAEKFSQALAHYMDMICAGVHPNEFTFVKLLATSYSLGLNYGKLLHAHLIRLGMRLNLVLKTALVNMYSKCQKMEDAIKVSNQTPDSDVLLWTSVISGFTQSLRVTDAIAALHEMELSGIVPNNFTYSSILKASSEILSLELGKQIHSRIIKAGLENDTCAGGALVDMYMKCSDLAEDALGAFRDITSPSVITWTSLIAGFSEHGFEKDSFQSFAEMRAVGVQPNSFTLSSILRACTGCDTVVGNALVDAYAALGMVDDAWHVVTSMIHRDAITYTCLATRMNQMGRYEVALDVIIRMYMDDVEMDGFSIASFLSSSASLAAMETGRQLHSYSIKAGLAKDAMEVIMTMPSKPDALIYKTLLGACKSHRNIALGEYVARQGIEVDPSDPAFYVLLANLYEESGQPDLAKSTRRVMRERGLKKNPGQCWMEIRNKVHLFNAGDRSHPQINEIHEKVESLITELKNRGNLYQDYEDSSYHIEKLAVAFGLLRTPLNASIRISKNMRICSECHNFIMIVTQFVDREIIVRDGNRLHVFRKGECSCTVAASLQQDKIFHNSVCHS
ncbi:hypothetical protein GBA52_006034 [Prunus armeniaca]|nr:hypothetical protein GBA52_006034 [Prunus armeniaca]